VLGLAEHERHDEAKHRRRQRRQARQVEAPPAVGPSRGQQPHAGGQQQHADRHVDQEYRAPRTAEEIRADQQAAHHLPDHRAARQHRRVETHRAGPRRALVGALDQAEHLRDHHGRADPLHDAQRDQRARRRGQPAAQRGDGEDREPGQEDPAVAEDVAQAGPGHQQHRVSDRVTGHHQLQAGP
jgi:hypothetical protein